MANFFEPPRYIAVEGPIRVGKSTLSKFLAEQLHGQLVHEPEDNAFLGAFYEGEAGAAFQTQFSFLIQRYEQLRPTGSRTLTRARSSLSITSLRKTSCSRTSISATPNLTFTTAITSMFRSQLPTPELVIYLQASVDGALASASRSATPPPSRASVTTTLKRSSKPTNTSSSTTRPAISWWSNTSDIDFVERSADLQQLLRRVSEPIKGTQYFLPLGQDNAASA